MENRGRDSGDHDGTRTRNLQIDSLEAENRKVSNLNRLHKTKTPSDTPRDTFAPKSTDNAQEADSPELPPDLASLVTGWPTIPLAIRQAVKAIVAPYIKESGE